MSSDIVIIGLPAEGLQALSGALGIRPLEDDEIRRAHDDPDQPRHATREQLAGRLEAQLRAAGHAGALLAYQTPWRFLARQLRKSTAAPVTAPQVEGFVGDTLGFWRAYHEALLGLRRRLDGRCVLLNADRPFELEAVAALLEQKLGVRAGANREAAPAASRRGAPGHEESYWQVVDRLAPDCLELYGLLESAAELMGRQPEFGYGRYPARDGGAAELLAAELKALSPQHKAELYLGQITQLQDELERQVGLNQQKDLQIAELKRQAEGRSLAVVRKLVRAAKGIGQSVLAFVASPRLSGFARRAGGRMSLRKEAGRIRDSGLFDEKWYLQRYPDVAKASLDPVEHYLKFGVSEGRNPSAHFNTRWYIGNYSDVAASGANPLLHYIDHGKSEGRLPTKAAPTAAVVKA